MNTWGEFIEQYREESIMRPESYISMYCRNLYDDFHPCDDFPCKEKKKPTNEVDEYLYRIGVNDDNV